MGKLHELLAAEKTPTAAWNTVREDTLKKFKNPTHFFEGHSKSLKMIADSPENGAIEAQAREEKPVTTTVLATLQYALDLFAKAEDLQAQKNATNRLATADVVFRGETILTGLPVDELLGLEARLAKIREVYEAAPTLDATRHWVPKNDLGLGVWEVKFPEDTTKTEKRITPIVMSPATEHHPAQIAANTSDAVVGKFTLVKRSGAVTALQKAEAIKLVDDLTIAIKAARMRANETLVTTTDSVGRTIANLLLAPFAEEVEGHN
jgi:hypothetical protein